MKTREEGKMTEARPEAITRIRTMTTYTEKRGITTKTEYTEFDAIGWSCLDASTIYRATVTEFNIARGVISVRTKVVNADGSDYKPTHYQNYNGGHSMA